MSRGTTTIAKLTVIALGWLVVVATTRRFYPVDHAVLEVELAIGPAAPSAAVVDVTFEGAFVDERNAVCAFVWAPAGEYEGVVREDVRVRIEVVGTLGATRAEPHEDQLVQRAAPLTDALYQACVAVTCGSEEPCGGRFSVALVDAPLADAGVNSTRLDPFAMVIAAETHAEPGRLPGSSSITLVETQP